MMKKTATGSTGSGPRSPKKIKRLLRALSRRQAWMKCEDREGGKGPLFGVYFLDEGRVRLIFRPDAGVVAHCLGEDLLVKTPAGWEIGDNGRLTLRRLLAGSDPFAEQHQERSVARRKINEVMESVVINDRASPLGWLSRRADASGHPMISKTQFAAGERLAQDFQFAGMMPRMTSTWSGSQMRGQGRNAPGTGVLMSDNRLAAKQRVRKALDEVGHDLADIMLDICCFQLGLSDAEKTRGWPRRSGKIILRIALDRLADHYGMTSKNKTHDGGAAISHWGTEGYKPTIS